MSALLDNLPDDWEVSTLGDLNTCKAPTLNPKDFVDETFEYYSIPDFQRDQCPSLINGGAIGSSKLLLKPKTVLFGKLNPRVEKVWHVAESSEFRQIGSTEWITILPNDRVDAEFLYFLEWSDHVMPIAKTLVSGSTPSRQRVDPTSFYRLRVPLPPLPEQKKIAHILSTVQRAIEAQERIIQTTIELKKALMHQLFTEGLRNEPQKQTEIGPVPESWETPTVEVVCTIKASAMSYKQLENAPNALNGVRVLGIKVSDMNLPDNEIEFHSANLERLLPEKEALKRTVPENSIVFPKRGAAIATNKKRLTTGRTVLDPNLIAVMPSEAVNHRYLFHWFNTFDLRNITDPGPTPQLNKKDIAPLKFPMPSLAEQEAITVAIDAAEEKTTRHRRKRDQLKYLFRTLLHELMTAKIRVDGLKLGSNN